MLKRREEKKSASLPFFCCDITPCKLGVRLVTAHVRNHATPPAPETPTPGAPRLIAYCRPVARYAPHMSCAARLV